MHTNRSERERPLSWVLSIVVLLTVQLMLAGSGGATPAPATPSAPSIEGAGDAAGHHVAGRRSLAGRHRLELRLGYWDTGHWVQETRVNHYAEVTTRVEDFLGAFSYAYWVHDKLATDVTATGLVVEATSSEGVAGTYENAVVVTSLLFGVRFYPVSSTVTPLRPYVAVGIGPYLGIQSEREVGFDVVENVKTLGSFGGYVGGGIDIQMGRHFMAGVHVGYNAMADFPEPIGLERNYNGLAVSAGLSLLLGKGSDR